VTPFLGKACPAFLPGLIVNTEICLPVPVTAPFLLFELDFSFLVYFIGVIDWNFSAGKQEI
jgi:hypothetical protein